MPSGIIIKGIGGFYYVKTSDGIYECKARGVFRKEDISPLTGDRVHISITDEEKKTGSLDSIEPRYSQLVRPAVANVNQIAIVIAAKSPSPDFMLLDKLLITAEMKGLTPVICINKVDLDEDGKCSDIESAYQKAGYSVVTLSKVLGIGYNDFRELLTDKITVLAGQSGVGKSTILNHIMNSMVMQTGNISEKIERGKHTTRHAELLQLEDGGFIVDSPGFSSFELADIEHTELEAHYPEFRDYLGKCRFTGCSHVNEPDCEVKKAFHQGLIDPGRYSRYSELFNAIKNIPKDYSKGKKKK